MDATEKYLNYLRRAEVNASCVQRSIKNDRPYAALAMAEALVRNLRDACTERDMEGAS